MRRRLLVSYVALTGLVLVLLEVPLGLVLARRERDTLASTARRETAALTVVAGEALEHPAGHNLTTLATTYRSETGTEVAVFDSAGRALVAFDPLEPAGTEPAVGPIVARALRGSGATTRATDDGHAQLLAAQPIELEGRIAGVVVVAVPAGSTDRRIVRAWWMLGALAMTLLAIAAVVGFVMARSLTAPLDHLRHAATRFGRGDLGARAKPSGPAELAAVGHEFNAMAERIHDLVDAQERLLSDVSHQLRTPLTALRLRLENAAAAAAPDVATELEAVEAESQRLTRLVDGLLTLNRPPHDAWLRQPVDAVAVAADRRDAWAPLAEERGVTLVVEARAEARVMAGPGDLEQILDNLLSNALDVSPSGAQITIGIDARHEAGGAVTVIHVRDQGPGMSIDDRDHAFDRFWQGRDRTGGTGLGLAIVRQLARANGGDVQLAQAVGGGLDAVVVLQPA